MRRADYRATFIVGLGYLTATLTGFLRQVAIARLLGASKVADIYLVAFAIPEFVFIALPIILSPAFLPIFSHLRQSEGEAVAWSFAQRIIRITGISLAILTILAAVVAPVFLQLISPGFSPIERQQSLTLFYPMLPAILFMGIATLIATILQVYRRFLQSVIITSAYNIVFILSLFLLPTNQIALRASWAVTFGAVSAFICVLPFWWKQSHVNTSPAIYPQGRIKDWSSFSFQLILGYGLHHLILFIDRAMATTFGAGSVAALSYADHLTLVIGQLTGLAVATVLFPSLAEKIANGDLRTAGEELSSGLTYVVRVALPACAGLILLRTPVVQVLFEHGAFDSKATSLVSAPILWYSIAVFADALCQPLWRIVYVKRSGWTVITINSLQTAIRLVGNLLLTPWLGYVGLAVSASIGLSIQVLALAYWTRRAFGFKLNANHWGKIIQTVAATTFAIATSGLIYNAIKANSPILVILLSSLCGALIYILVLNLSNNFRSVFYGR